MPPPREMTLSGPSDVQPTSPAHAPQAERTEAPQDAIAAAMGGARRAAPVGAAAGAPAIGGVGRAARPTDVARLQTNRGEGAAKAAPATSEKPIGRNDPCPCGSGKKYKKCHGAAA